MLRVWNVHFFDAIYKNKIKPTITPAWGFHSFCLLSSCNLRETRNKIFRPLLCTVSVRWNDHEMPFIGQGQLFLIYELNLSRCHWVSFKLPITFSSFSLTHLSLFLSRRVGTGATRNIHATCLTATLVWLETNWFRNNDKLHKVIRVISVHNQAQESACQV